MFLSREKVNLKKQWMLRRTKTPSNFIFFMLTIVLNTWSHLQCHSLFMLLIYSVLVMSRVHLQRLLGTRLALLRKEQAMAYARGLVAGFEIHNLDALIWFANTFGASRLRYELVTTGLLFT